MSPVVLRLVFLKNFQYECLTLDSASTRLENRRRQPDTSPPPPSAFAIVPALETEFQFTEVITRLNGSAEAAGLSLAKINKMNK